MPGPEVMLATASTGDLREILAQLERAGNWWTEIKFDGIRAVLTRTSDGQVMITNRRQADISHRYPDVVASWSQQSFVGVLDGEIVVFKDGRPNFEGAHRRDAQSSPGKIRAAMAKDPAIFIPFDVLEQGERDLRALPYTQRRIILMNLGVPGVSSSSQDIETMWEFVQANKLEGLVAKRGDSAYRPGRQGAWRKIKHTKRISALVGGVVPGRGSRGPVGALELYLFDDVAGRLVGIGNVGSGMTGADLRTLSQRISRGEATVVEVEFLEVSSTGQLRMPVFRGIRHDVDPADCVLSSLR
jgi:bifunctional non-homologous end joining protein LigD